MEERTVRNTIKRITKHHLINNNSLLFGQCLSAVGWVGNTIPNDVEDHIVELPTSDVMNGGVVVGSALMGRRSFYVIRYQGFNWFNLIHILNYACKSKEMWDKPCPMFIRTISMEKGIGPVASSSHISMAYKMPGIKIFSPMTPREYEHVYDRFMEDDDVYLVSEHRGSYDNEKELINVMDTDKIDIILMPISITRFEAEKAREKLKEQGINAGILHQVQLKPFLPPDKKLMKYSKHGALIIDDDFTSGIAKTMAYDVMMETGCKVHVMGLEDRTTGFHTEVDNLPPSCDKIVQKVKDIIKK